MQNPIFAAMQYLRLLLFPFSLLYGFIILVRNKAYDAGLFASRKFDIPIICIGNLAVGGSGKSPMAEYIIRLLKDKKKIAVLSRGYGRKTKGFRLVEATDNTSETGDEPLQFKQKFEDITVAVCEKRVVGIEKLQADNEVVILDDAYQHRAVQAGLNILLFDYTRLGEPFVVFPTGNFRENFAGRSRAQIIIVTKTPDLLSDEEKLKIRSRVKPYPYQTLLFSYLDYGDLIAVYSSETIHAEKLLSSINTPVEIFLLTGIANPAPMVEELSRKGGKVKHYDYPDHHPFTTKNIAKLVSDFKASGSENKIIVTTEKDAQRLRNADLEELLKTLPVYYLPVKAKFNQADEKQFNLLIENYAS
jgi:tetraacyldisaccharide 4'-kinase